MIIAKLTGGMGNQLFQYAFGTYLARKHNTVLKLDLNFFKTYEWHEYSIGPFQIEEHFATNEDIAKLIGNYPSKFRRILHRVMPGGKLWKEKDLPFDPHNMDAPDNSYLDGFWQCEKYFLPIEEEIRRSFKVKIAPTPGNKEMLDRIASNSAAVCLHIRRGNFVNVQAVNNVHGTCSIDYYERGMQYILERAGNACFFIFSDDIPWVKQNLVIPALHYFVENNDAKTDYEDFRMMSACRHFITANSTFSWWAAWLSEHSNKMIIAPKQWMADPQKDAKMKDLIPANWIRI